MASKRYKKLPKKTNELAPSLVEKLIPEIKNIVLQSLMSQLT